VQILGVLGSSHVLTWALGWLPGSSTSRIATRLAESAGQHPAQRVDEFLRDALLTGTLEELLFRGLVFEVVRRARGAGAAILTSAALFGIAHGDWYQGIAAGLLGIQLGALRLFYGLGLAVLAHVVNNGLAFWTASQPLSPSLPTSGIALILSFGCSTVACASLLRLWRRVGGADSVTAEPLQTTSRSDD
jgi:hypothetical protein